jgi:ferredoxin
MANLSDRLPNNVPGQYYVDSTCIDCDQCRVQAPDFFARDDNGFSYIVRQPATAEEVSLLEEVIAGCATSSIGNDGA